MKILLSGGHLTPALALLDYALGQHQEVVFVGRTFAQEQTKQLSREQQEVLQHGAKFISFSSAKITTTGILELTLLIPRLLLAFGQAMKIIQSEKPDVFVSFGGYLAVPLAIAAWIFRIPVITHEQTRSSGLANKFIAKFAKYVAISYEETMTSFPTQKTFFVGNPIRKQLLEKKNVQPSWLNTKSQKPLLYITGGSQGSQIINMTIWQVMPKLVQDWVVIHQCGNPTKQMNYRLELEQRQKALPLAHQKNYFVVEWVSAADLAWIYTHAKVIISRGGANTVQELLILGKPAIFIPLLIARDDEQLKNAQAVVETGAALLLPQKELNGENLLALLSEFKRSYPSLLKHAKQNQKKFDLNADQRLYDLVLKAAQP